MFKLLENSGKNRERNLNSVGNTEIFSCTVGNTAEAWSHCSSKSNSDKLRVWFSCTPSVLIKCVRDVAKLDVCTENEQN